MSTRRSLFFSFLDRYASLLVSVVSSMVIARLLTPTEIGVFSVTMVLLMFVNTVRDMGAGQYLVQEKDLTTERIRTVWAVQLGLGLGLAGLVLLASYPVSVFYNEPRMFNIMLVVALNYAVNPFGSLTYAWLMREMRFESVAIMRFSAGLAGAVVSAWLAWLGYGAISLAFGSLGSTVVNAVIAVAFRPKTFPWLPGLGEIKRVLSFGSQLTGSSLMNVIANGAPEMLLGKLQTVTAVGLYSRSNGLVQMFYRLFVDAVSTVCLPWFAKQSRENGDFTEPFVKATAYITAFGWSFCAAVVFLAHPVINVLYGDQWNHSVDLARLLAVAMAFSVPAALCGTALLACGASKVVIKATAINTLASVTLVAIGASLGLLELGIASIVAAGISTLVLLNATLRQIDAPMSALVVALRQSAVVALVGAIGPAMAYWIYGPYPLHYFLPLVMGGIGGLAGFCIGVLATKHPLKTELVTAWNAAKPLIKF